LANHSRIITSVNKRIFFDESGKSDDYPVLMGGVSIPESIYSKNDFSNLNGIRTHWSDFTRKDDLKILITTLSKFYQVVNINVINYNYQAVLEDSIQKFQDESLAKNFANKTIYAKFPERIFYGLLRNNPQHMFIRADVSIEESTEYNTSLVKSVVENDLNVQSIYRGESFLINNVELKPKGVDVGLEMTDLVLGIMRTIIKNSRTTNRNKRKNKFIINLFKNEDFVYKLFSERVRLYEWNQNTSLRQIDFNEYLEAFINSNNDLWYE